MIHDRADEGPASLHEFRQHIGVAIQCIQQRDRRQQRPQEGRDEDVGRFGSETGKPLRQCLRLRNTQLGQTRVRNPFGFAARDCPGAIVR